MVTLALNYTTTSLLVKISACSKRNEKHLADLKSALDSSIRETHLTLRSINGELESIQTTQNDVRGRVEELHGRQDMEEALRKRQRILDWLTPIDHASEQRDAISRRQKGTGEWLLRSQTYQDWLSTDSRTLFCPGIPGAGKTVFASIINADLWERYHDDPTVGLAHLFCNYRRHNEQTLEALLSGLLKQLVQHQVPLPECVTSLYDTQQKGASDRIEATTEALRSAMATYSRVFIVLDALDECSTSQGCRTRLLSSIQNLQKHGHINILATSRFIPEITEKFKTACELEIQADSNDVREYLSDNIYRLPGFVQDNVSLQEEVVSKIVEAVRGISAKKVKLALNELATGSDAYDSAYDSAVKRINGQVPDQAELAKQALAFLTCARASVSTEALRDALAVEIGEPDMDQENYPDIEDVLASCLGLVTVDEDCGIIRLVHYTTQEYLQRTLDRWFPDAQAMIASTCVSYLSLDRYADLNNLDPSEDCEWYIYSARHWIDHARLAPSSLTQVVSFLTRQANVIKSFFYTYPWVSAKHVFEREHVVTQHPHVTGLHVAVMSQLEATTAALLQQGFDVHARDRLGRTPLIVAAQPGREAIVELLLKYDSSLDLKTDNFDDTDSQDYDAIHPGSTALHFASRNGSVSTVRALLAHGATVDSKDARNATPLHHAIINGQTEVVRVLINANANLSSTVWSATYRFLRQDGFKGYLEPLSRKTLLATAVESESVEMVSLLIEAGVDVNEHGDHCAPALIHAVSRLQGTAMVEVLLKAGANPNLTGWRGASPLMEACGRRYRFDRIDVAKLLLDAGAEINHTTADFPIRSALAGAHWEGKPKIIQYLVERGADLKLGLRYDTLTTYTHKKAPRQYYMSDEYVQEQMLKYPLGGPVSNGST
ncbi:uncharacterized protein J4E87_006995 [Alternaria ethzedia]|uniref:uncharacterized protein n=1 Tax=Alternaria ethzedia TaxID=181014 RepID=UPI0020C38866|nr:uncharacterized protein J4E87_006995 [Alternaria ethzedia]KAI4620670.1 hypothetical protein J4E87_006995 [Alternaria ethzedia]